MSRWASTEERFFAKVDVQPGVCWEWLAGKRDGYGRFQLADSLPNAHRWIYEHLVGPIPDGLTLDHLCRNRGCVNPDHLEPVTNQENIRRGALRHINGNKTHCPEGHEYTGDNVHVSVVSSRHCRTCRREQQIKRRRQNGVKPLKLSPPKVQRIRAESARGVDTPTLAIAYAVSEKQIRRVLNRTSWGWVT